MRDEEGGSFRAILLDLVQRYERLLRSFAINRNEPRDGVVVDILKDHRIVHKDRQAGKQEDGEIEEHEPRVGDPVPVSSSTSKL